MEIDRYGEGDSVVHRWDPRVKTVCLFLFVFTCTGVSRWVPLGVLFFGAIGFTICTRLPRGFVFKTLKWPLVFLLFMVPVLMLSSGGRIFFEWGPIKFYMEGVLLGGKIVLRSVTIILGLMVLFGTSKLNVLMKAMESLKFPKVLLMLLNFTYRYIFLYLENLQKLSRAAGLRGFRLQNGIVSFRTNLNILTALLIRSYEQSERTYSAMKLRGFQGSFCTLKEFQIKRSDIFKAACIVLIILPTVLMEILQ